MKLSYVVFKTNLKNEKLFQTVQLDVNVTRVVPVLIRDHVTSTFTHKAMISVVYANHPAQTK